MKDVKKALYPNKTPSPPGSKERKSNPPTPFEQRYANYENFDPSQPFAPYVSQAFDAPHPEQPRPSMVDQISADIFGDLNLGVASSSHTSLPHATMPSFIDHLCTPSQDRIGLHLMMIHLRTNTRSQNIKLLRTLIFFFLDDC
jgi:hypothetical protein